MELLSFDVAKDEWPSIHPCWFFHCWL